MVGLDRLGLFLLEQRELDWGTKMGIDKIHCNGNFSLEQTSKTRGHCFKVRDKRFRMVSEEEPFQSVVG